jgi:hypothetical protein
MTTSYTFRKCAYIFQYTTLFEQDKLVLYNLLNKHNHQESCIGQTKLTVIYYQICRQLAHHEEPKISKFKNCMSFNMLFITKST